MNQITKKIEIDLYSPASYEVIKAQQGDNKSRIIEFVLLDKGEPYHISDNIKINLEGCRGDHSGFIKENYCQVTDNVISVALDSDILYAPGTVEAKIVMYDNGSILSTIPFKISVQQNPRDKENIEKDKKSVLDDLVNKLDNLSGTVKKNMDDDITQENVINFLVNNTYKNLLRNSAATKTVNGVTFTVNPDKSVTVNGTATADTTFLIGLFYFDDDKLASYEYTGTPANGSNTTYYTELKHCRISGGYSEYYNEYGKGIYLVNNDYYAYVVVNLKIMNGYTADNLIFYPMIRLSSISDKSYVPYNSAPVEIGDTAELVTNSKTNVVSAINEVNDSITTTKSTLEEHKNDTVHHIGAHERDAWNQAQTEISNSLNTIQSTIETKVDKAPGMGLSSNDYTSEEKNKLKGIENGAEVNQNAFSIIHIEGGTPGTIVAQYNTSSVSLLPGTHMQIKKMETVNNSSEDTIYFGLNIPNVNNLENGLMTSEDKVKLDDFDNTYATKSSINAITNTIQNNVSTNGRTNSLALGRDVKAGTNGDYSIAVGINANANTRSTALGYGANAYSMNDVAIGYHSASNINSVAIGYNAVTNNSSVAIGCNAVTNNSSVAIGCNAITKNNSVAIGHDVAINGRGTAIGYRTRINDTAIAIGWDGTQVSGSCSIGIGGCSSISGFECIGIGDKIYSLDGKYSIAIGYQPSIRSNNSMAIGYNASIGNYADNSVAIGCNTNVRSNSTNSIAVGYNTNIYDFSNRCVAIGYQTSITSNVNDSIVIGTGAHACSSNSTAIGANSSIGASITNSTAIGYYASTSNSNSMQLGSSSILSSITARVGITVTSDERDKTDIVELEDKAIEFLNKIKTIRYVYNNREMYIPEILSDEEQQKREKFGLCEYDKEAHAAGTKKKHRVRIGVSAQDTQKALKEVFHDLGYADLVNDNFFDYSPDEIPEGVENQLGVNYEKFIPFLIKGIQELDTRLTLLEERTN